ncbi:MAG: SpoIIE family protein phosphatase, partial [Clostridia bacterium]|nr:SpoIIE family protein phosphatase [Clostridia bacterium]
VCGDCKQKTDCWRNNLERTEGSLFKLTECALNRGKVTILDISPTLSFRCDRLNYILSTINTHAESFLSFIKKSKETDGNRLLIGEQLGGVSQIMQQLAVDCRSKIMFDQAKEKQIAEDLTFHNVLTKEAIFLEQGQSVSVILTLARADYNQEVVQKIVSNAVKKQMQVEKVESTVSDKWVSVYLTPKPRFGVAYGVSSATKSQSVVSGDTHSFVNVGTDKVMFAICDGMGSGTQAEKMSDTTISLIENFYRAGFDNDVILNCVNKLLGSFNTDTFTAVDVCVVDLQTGLADFIKLGASNGIVKNQGQVQYVVGSSLPIGILDEMKPSISTKALCDGDIVVLFSDGAWDCVENADILAQYVAQTVLVNPQIIADDLLKIVLAQCKNQPKDDVTILVARINQ